MPAYLTMKRLLFLFVLFGIAEITKAGFCLQSQHPCSDLSCIPRSSLCNGDHECVDGSDEDQCAERPTCNNGKIPCTKRNGQTICVDSQEDCPEMSCGAGPTINNGAISFTGKGNKKSSVGAWADVICDDGYKSCTNKIQCLESGVWTTTSCGPTEQEPVDECTAQEGECTAEKYSSANLAALISTDCDYFCQCVQTGTNVDGSVSYNWQKMPCPPGTKFDMSLSSPACNHANAVTCG